MFPPRWRKVLADLWSNKTRSLLTLLTIAVGVLVVGFDSATSVILEHDLNADYQAANPSVATLYTDPFKDDLLTVLRKMPGVAQVEGRSSVSARVVAAPEQKIVVHIIGIPAADEMQINKIRPQAAGQSLALKDREIFIERAGLGVLPVKTGDTVSIELSGGRRRELRVAGIVHDVTCFPYTVQGSLTAYVTPATIEWLGGTQDYTQLLLTVTERPTDAEHVRAVAQGLSDKIKKSGREMYATSIYKPGRHFAADINQAMIAIMSLLGALTLFLGMFLVINTITALLAQHVRQIGIMKTIGAQTTQIAGMYLGFVLCFSLLALVISIPLSAYIAWLMGSFLAGFLNFNLGPFRIMPEAVVWQVVVALLVPLGAAGAPVLNSARITIREALGVYGVGKGHFGKSVIDRLVERIRFFTRPLLISLRNTIRRKARLMLTLSTLTLAGAIFIAVFNLWAAFDVTLNEIFGYFVSDVNVDFNQEYRLQKLKEIALSVPGVVEVEGWGATSGQLLSPDKTAELEILFIAPPAGSTLVKPVLTGGRWLLPDDENAIVIGNHLLKERPDLKVGDQVVIKIRDVETVWQIVGTFRLLGNMYPPPVYANYEPLARAQNSIGLVNNVRVVTAGHDAAAQAQVGQRLEAQFKKAQMRVASVSLGTNLIAQQKVTTDVLVYFLMAMALMIAVVGGLGLTGTMSMNVLERTREIGVMRSIGASSADILQLVIVEGMLIGVVSWALAVVFSVPISWGLNYGVGASMLNAPMDFTWGVNGLMIWLMVVLTLSALASAWPALNAARLTIREVLAYE